MVAPPPFVDLPKYVVTRNTWRAFRSSIYYSYFLLKPGSQGMMGHVTASLLCFCCCRDAALHACTLILTTALQSAVSVAILRFSWYPLFPITPLGFEAHVLSARDKVHANELTLFEFRFCVKQYLLKLLSCYFMTWRVISKGLKETSKQ